MTGLRPIAEVPSGCAGCDIVGCPLARLGGAAVRGGVIEAARGDRLCPPPAGVIRMRALLSGLAAHAVGLADGRRQLVELETAGEVFCGGDGPDGTSWIEVLAPSRICELDYPAAAVSDRDLLTALFGVTHQKLARSAARTVALGRLDGGERVCGFLVDMASRIGLRRGEGCYFSLPLSREDIADYLGLNAETVSRLFGRLKKAGLVIFVTPTELMIPDIGALASRAAGVPEMAAAGPAAPARSAPQ